MFDNAEPGSFVRLMDSFVFVIKFCAFDEAFLLNQMFYKVFIPK